MHSITDSDAGACNHDEKVSVQTVVVLSEGRALTQEGGSQPGRTGNSHCASSAKERLVVEGRIHLNEKAREGWRAPVSR